MTLGRNPRLFSFIKRRVVTLLVPYLAWCFFRVCVVGSLTPETPWKLFDLVWTGTGTMWFIPALFTMQMLLVLYSLLVGKTALGLRQLVVFLLFCIGMLCYHRYGCRIVLSYLPWSPHYLTPIFNYFFSFSLGVFIYSHRDLWRSLINSGWLMTCCLCVFFYYACRIHEIPCGAYGHIAVGICGVIVVLRLLVFSPDEQSSVLSRFSNHPIMRQLAWVGRSSLGIYLFSDYLLPGMPFVPDYAGCPEFVLGFAYSVVVCYLCILVEYVVCLSPALAFVFYGKRSSLMSRPSGKAGA